MAALLILAKEALSQMPRLLSLLDRNAGSRTYGCFYRIYWHDKATDIPCAHPQLSVLALALAYRNKMPGNCFFGKEKMLDWIIGSLEFWASIQNRDGSFNEHYPNEHSFGAVAWTLSAVADTLRLVGNEVQTKDFDTIFEAAYRAAKWLVKNDEPGLLTNHQAVAAFALHRMARLSGDGKLADAAKKRVKITLGRQSKEGWFLEYDGADLGYLTTTISFLAGIFRETHDPRILRSLRKAIDLSSYFVYPDGSYGGVIGSRNTAHFHPHGFELMSKIMPMARAVADKAYFGIARGTGVTPKAMDDKYLGNLVIEFLQAYLDHTVMNRSPKVPCDQAGSFEKKFKQSGLTVVKRPDYYMTVSTGKGGVFKIFDRKKCVISDAGLCGTFSGKSVTSQWLDPSYKAEFGKGTITVSGKMHEVSTKQTLSSKDFILTRIGMLTLGRSNTISFLIKKGLIKKLITKSRAVPIKFERKILFSGNEVGVEDLISQPIPRLGIDAEFASRYVPASRYFQRFEVVVPETASLPENTTVIKRLIFPKEGKIEQETR